MGKGHMRLVVAILICLSGVALLVNGYVKSRPPKQHDHIEREVSQEVADTLHNNHFVEVDQYAEIDAIEMIHAEVVKQASLIPQVRNLGDQSIRDLADAFTERVSSLYWPDIERDFQNSLRRGDPTPLEEMQEMYSREQLFRESFDWNPRVDFDGVVVSFIYYQDDELNIKRERYEAGLGAVTGNRSVHKFPIPENPVEDGFVCVEIVMPMYQYEVKSNSMKPVVMGYHFAWNATIKKWVPYESVLFNAPGMIFGVPRI